jgi:hypothetical protein
MTLGVQGRSARAPFAAQVFLEYLGARTAPLPGDARHRRLRRRQPGPAAPRRRMLAVGGAGMHMMTAIELPV